MTDPPTDLFEDLARIDDPLERLAALARAREDVDAIETRYVAARRRAILEARELDSRPTWREIGEIFGVSAQRAEMMSRQEPTQPERNQP